MSCWDNVLHLRITWGLSGPVTGQSEISPAAFGSYGAVRTTRAELEKEFVGFRTPFSPHKFLVSLKSNKNGSVFKFCIYGSQGLGEK